MKIYRKRPLRVKAIQWTGSNTNEVVDFITNEHKHWYYMGKSIDDVLGFDGERLTIDTLEGQMLASQSDYIIAGIEGEIYPCKKEIFEASYEEIT